MNVTLLAGGVGGARLAHGLDLALSAAPIETPAPQSTSPETPPPAPENQAHALTVVVNVGDDVPDDSAGLFGGEEHPEREELEMRQRRELTRVRWHKVTLYTIWDSLGQ